MRRSQFIADLRRRRKKFLPGAELRAAFKRHGHPDDDVVRKRLKSFGIREALPGDAGATLSMLDYVH